MMPYMQKEKIKNKTRKKTFVFDDFALFCGGKNSLIASESINCDCGGGVLSYGIGVKPYVLPNGALPQYTGTEILSAAHLLNRRDNDNNLPPKEKIFLAMQEGKLYSYDQNQGNLELVFETCTVSARAKWSRNTEKTQLYFFGRDRSVMQKDGNSEIIHIGARDLGLSRVCNDRVFASLGRQNVKYTSLDGDFHDYSLEKSGTLYGAESDGELKGLAVIGKDLYVFFNKIIKRVRVEGSTLEFDIEKIPYVGKPIYYNTICECDDGIFFLAEDGVYRFDGKRAGQVCAHLGISPAADDMSCVGANTNGEYVLAYTDKNGVKKMAVISADGKSGYFSTPMQALTENGHLALFLSGGYICAFDKNSHCVGDAYFRTRKLDFGTLGRKTLQRLHFFGKGVADVRLQGDGWERVQRVDLEKGVFVWEIWDKSTEFTLEIILEQGTQIQKIAAEVVFP